MPATPLILGQTQRQELATLRQTAMDSPIDVLAVRELVKTREGRAAYMQRMAAFTVRIPQAFCVTFSIETGHGAGPCRHLSVSVERRGRTPTPQAVWLLAEQLGFQGDLQACAVWDESIGEGDIAINVVQPLGLDPASMTVH